MECLLIFKGLCVLCGINYVIELLQYVCVLNISHVMIYHLYLFVQDSYTMLHGASKGGHEELVIYLLSMGATVNIQNRVSVDIYIV